MQRKIIFIFLVVFATLASNAQNVFVGRVVDTIDNIFVPNVYVENINQNFLTQADENGVFSLPAELGDTLVFSAVGYNWAKHVVTCKQSVDVYLLQKNYNIGRVIKYAPLTYYEFKRQILAMEYVDDTLDLKLPYEKYYPMGYYVPGELSYNIEGVITSVYNSLSKHAKNEMRAIELIQNEHKLLSINQKFNKSIVLELTNINEDYLEMFVAYCTFSDDFLYEATEFQIISLMYLKFDEFLIQYPEAKL